MNPTNPDGIMQLAMGFWGSKTLLSAIELGISEQFPWSSYQRFADVGAAQGMVPVTVARAHGHLKGIGFDLPVVRPMFEDFVGENGVSDRVKFQAGDFFRDELPKVDVIVMGHILHELHRCRMPGLDARCRLYADARRAIGGA